MPDSAQITAVRRNMESKNMSHIDLLRELLTEVDELPLLDNNALDLLRRRTNLLIEKIFGSSSQYRAQQNNISFRSWAVPTSKGAARSIWMRGVGQLRNLIGTMIEDIELSTSGLQGVKERPNTDVSDKVFVVHGHDQEMKQSAARALEQLGLKPIILHEKPDKGRTIIEKFSDYADVGFAVVLLSPDDLGYQKSVSYDKAKFRARQNVILELGFFLGKLGRDRVIALHREDECFEMPSDYDGVIYTPFDGNGAWKLKLVQELRAAGYGVDANALID